MSSHRKLGRSKLCSLSHGESNCVTFNFGLPFALRSSVAAHKFFKHLSYCTSNSRTSMPSKVSEHKAAGYYVQQRPWTPTKRRGPIAAEFQSPGPASVFLPSTFGISSKDGCKVKSPAYTFGFKPEEKRIVVSPGPGEYSVDGVLRTGKEFSPAAFMADRIKEPEPFNTPAPGSYNPNRSISSMRGNAPSYTFGAKLKEPKPDDTPGPCSYEPDKNINAMSTHIQPPSFTIGLRASDENIEKIPGPCDYNLPGSDVYKYKSLSYTCRPKTTLPTDKTKKPAPNNYNTEKVWITKSSPPQFTFGVRHSAYSSGF